MKTHSSARVVYLYVWTSVSCQLLNKTVKMSHLLLVCAS